MTELQFIAFCAGLPNVKTRKMVRFQNWRIFYKPGIHYAHSWEIWNHIKFMYETMNKKPLSTDDVHLKVFEKYITVQFN